MRRMAVGRGRTFGGVGNGPNRLTGGTMGSRERPGVGVGVMVLDGGRVLLVRRLHHGAGSWAAPGGYLDQGESFEGCAEREVREETGVEIGDVRVVGMANDRHPDGKHNVTIWLTAGIAGGEAHLADPTEADAVGWFPVERLPDGLYLSTQNFVDGEAFPADAWQSVIGQLGDRDS